MVGCADAGRDLVSHSSADNRYQTTSRYTRRRYILINDNVSSTLSITGLFRSSILFFVFDIPRWLRLELLDKVFINYTIVSCLLNKNLM